jgi:N-acetylglucosamine repressor
VNKLYVKKGTNFEDVLEMNRSLILKLIRKYGVCTRVQLAKDTGLKQASITKIISSLIQLGIVREVGIVEGKKGRRSIGISINSQKHKVIGIKLARRSFSVGLYDISGQEYKVHSEQLFMVNGSAFALKRMKEVVAEFLLDQSDVAAIGIASPGPFIKSNESIALITEFPGWENVNLQLEFTNEFSIPVFVEHDANAGALAEWWFGNYLIDTSVMVYILVSEGVGAGIISEGQLFTGSQGIAGEVGHMSIDFNGRKCSCGNYGCLEKYCSTLALVKDTVENLENFPNSVLNNIEEINVENIFEALEQGDELAKEMIEKVAMYLGLGIVNLVNVYNPNCIIIGEIISKGGEVLINKIRETIEPRLLPGLFENLTIQLSKFSKDPILYGAAAIATDNFLKNPTAYLV